MLSITSSGIWVVSFPWNWEREFVKYVYGECIFLYSLSDLFLKQQNQQAYDVLHTNTQIHKRWIGNLNTNKSNKSNKSNILSKYIELKKLVKEQRQIISQKDIEIQGKDVNIHCLSQQLLTMKKPETTTDLLNFD